MMVNCKIDSLPEDIAQLSKLKILDLAGNNISELPESLLRLNNLSEINLAQNQLSHISERFAYQPKLYYLNLKGNPIPQSEVMPLKIISKRKDLRVIFEP